MMHSNQFNVVLSDKALANHFSRFSDKMADETNFLGQVVQLLLDAGKPVTNKNLIACLVKGLECADDFIQADIIRSTLEVVMSYTFDDF